MAFVVAVIVLVFSVCLWSIRVRDLIQTWRKVPNIEPDKPVDLSESPPLISVIVPAHNEEAAIEDCIRSVLAQDYPRLELIVADDRSEDTTLAIARSVCEGHPGCRIISVKDLPQGWTGKCHALDAAVQHSSGEWLAFLDADSQLGKEALRQCIGEAQRSGANLITLMPRFEMRGFWDKVLQPAFGAMFCILFPPWKVNDPDNPAAYANGMFYLISRSAYDKIGGHRDVRELAVEDVGIGKRVKALGLGLLLANGQKVMRTRMYTGFKDTMEGWIRILSGSMNYELATVVKYLLMHILISLPVIAASLIWYIRPAMALWPHTWFILPGITLGLMVIVSNLFLKEMGLSTTYSVFLMLGQFFVLWSYVVIVKRVLCRDVLQWRGTTYHSSRYEPGRLNQTSADIYRER